MGTKLNAADRRDSIKHGFDLTGDKTINEFRRLIMAVNAMEKCGKTTFGLSSTPTIAYFNFDRKVERVTLDSLGIPSSNLMIKELRVDGDKAQDEHKAQWNDYYNAWMWALKDAESIRSIVVDTESEMWELARLAYFGKLTQVMPYQYTELNAVYKNMLDAADRHSKNVIFLRKLKKQYVSDVWKGGYEPAGFGKVKDIVQINAEMYIDDGNFTMEILSNGLKAGMNGETFVGSMCTFSYVAAMMTDTLPDEWM